MKTIPMHLEWPEIRAKMKFIIPGRKSDLATALIDHLSENKNLTEEDRKFYVDKVRELLYSR